jgi:hypothetical protein
MWSGRVASGRFLLLIGSAGLQHFANTNQTVLFVTLVRQYLQHNN